MITLVPGQEITLTHLVREAKRSVEHILVSVLKLGVLFESSLKWPEVTLEVC